MIIVALVLVAACAVVILGAIFGDPSEIVSLAFFDMFDVEVTSIGAFLVGVVTGAVSLLALWLLVKLVFFTLKLVGIVIAIGIAVVAYLFIEKMVRSAGRA